MHRFGQELDAERPGRDEDDIVHCVMCETATNSIPTIHEDQVANDGVGVPTRWRCKECVERIEAMNKTGYHSLRNKEAKLFYLRFVTDSYFFGNGS